MSGRGSAATAFHAPRLELPAAEEEHRRRQRELNPFRPGSAPCAIPRMTTGTAKRGDQGRAGAEAHRIPGRGACCSRFPLSPRSPGPGSQIPPRSSQPRRTRRRGTGSDDGGKRENARVERHRRGGWSRSSTPAASTREVFSGRARRSLRTRAGHACDGHEIASKASGVWLGSPMDPLLITPTPESPSPESRYNRSRGIFLPTWTACWRTWDATLARLAEQSSAWTAKSGAPQGGGERRHRRLPARKVKTPRRLRHGAPQRPHRAPAVPPLAARPRHAEFLGVPGRMRARGPCAVSRNWRTNSGGRPVRDPAARHRRTHAAVCRPSTG